VFKERRLSCACLFFLVAAVLPSRAQVQNEVSGLASDRDQFQLEMVPRDGFNLYYRSLGCGEPVLIVSGGPGDDCDYLLPVASQIAKYAHVILLEQRGTGRSIPPRVDKTTINLALYLEDYEALRTYLKVEQWTVVGHSAGGLLAMNYAAAHPERVKKLVLLDTVPVSSRLLSAFQDNLLSRLSMNERDRFSSAQKSSSPEDQKTMTELQLEGLFYNRRVGEQLAGELSNAWHGNVGRLLGTKITAPGYDLGPRLKAFDNPVLVLNGRQDPMDPLMAYETSVAFKHSTLKYIDRAGHFPWFEQPKEFDQMIRDFLAPK